MPCRTLHAAVSLDKVFEPDFRHLTISLYDPSAYVIDNFFCRTSVSFVLVSVLLMVFYVGDVPLNASYLRRYVPPAAVSFMSYLS